MKAVVAAFNQEKALVGAFSVITNLRMELFEALLSTVQLQHRAPARHGAAAADHELPRPKLPGRDLPGGGQPQLGGPGITYRAGVLLTDGCAHAQWAAELDTVSRALAAARPDLGLFVVNCPLHVAVVEQNSYVEMKVGKLQLASFGGKSCKSEV